MRRIRKFIPQACIGINVLAILFSVVFEFKKPVVLGLNFILLSFILFFWIRYKRRVESAMALATMFVSGLKKEKSQPPISKINHSKAQPLMEALNELAADIENKNQVIAKLEKMKMEFVANVSHELKTPLASIRGYTETLLAGGYKDEQIAEPFLKRIDQNSQSLDALISDILELARLEALDNEIIWSTFPADALKDFIEQTFFPALKQSTHTLSLEFEDPILEGDQKKLQRIFSNLIDNAIKYTPRGTPIKFRESRNGNTMVYTIEDRGPGIDAKHLSRIFERFYRVDVARSRDSGGTGLGLSIAKHIALAHGGTLGVESAPGVGTRFTVTVPRRVEVQSLDLK